MGKRRAHVGQPRRVVVIEPIGERFIVYLEPAKAPVTEEEQPSGSRSN